MLWEIYANVDQILIRFSVALTEFSNIHIKTIGSRSKLPYKGQEFCKLCTEETWMIADKNIASHDTLAYLYTQTWNDSHKYK